MRCLTKVLQAIALILGLGMAPALAGGAGELRIGMTQFPSTLNPNIESMLAKTYVLAMTQRPLTAYNHDWELICMLCLELPSIEAGTAEPEPLAEGGQGITTRYTLQPDATWGDGTPVTTQDVLFTWEVGRHPQAGISNFELYKRILGIDAIDDKTFVMHGDRITFEYASAGDFRLLPAHIERPIFEANPAEYRNRTAFDSDPTNPGLYFGPYRIAQLESGSHITLEPNPTWYGKAPAFDRITVRVIENTAALEANLLSGAIDMIAGELGLTLDQAIAFEKRHSDRFTVLYETGLIYEHIDMNLDNPILQDKRVRQALITGIDREAVSQQLFDGRQPVADGPVSPLDWVYEPNVPKYSYDPDKAAALLDEAGWSDMRQGVRHNAAGEPLMLEFSTTAGNRARELVQQVLQSQWRQIGIDVRIKNQPARVFFGESMRRRLYTGLAMYAWLSSPENVPRTTLHSEQIPTETNGWGGQNTPGFENEEMDRLIDDIEVELDRPERKLLWSRLQKIYAEELPAIPLYWRAQPYVLPNWLKGVRPTGHQFTSTLWIEEWRREDG